MSRIVGNEGSITIGVLPNGAYHNITANSWSMTISRVVSDVTAYGDTASNFVGGIPTYTGSIAGFLATESEPSLGAANFASAESATITLICQTGEQFSGTAIVSGFSVSSTKTGDCTISMDFSFSGGITSTWTG